MRKPRVRSANDGPVDAAAGGGPSCSTPNGFSETDDFTVSTSQLPTAPERIRLISLPKTTNYRNLALRSRTDERLQVARIDGSGTARLLTARRGRRRPGLAAEFAQGSGSENVGSRRGPQPRRGRSARALPSRRAPTGSRRHRQRSAATIRGGARPEDVELSGTYADGAYPYLVVPEQTLVTRAVSDGVHGGSDRLARAWSAWARSMTQRRRAVRIWAPCQSHASGGDGSSTTVSGGPCTYRVRLPPPLRA